MSCLGVGISPGNVPVRHGTKAKVIDRRVRVFELVLRCVICGLGIISSILVATDTQVKEIFMAQKEAKYTEMKALGLLVITNGLAAGYSLLQAVRCIVSKVKGKVLFNKPLAWAIFSGDQIVAYLTAAAVATATQSAVLAKLGQENLHWMKLCDVYGKFCNRAGEGVACALLMSLSFAVLASISAFSLFRLYGSNKSGIQGSMW